MSKYTAKDLNEGNVPLFVTTKEFRQIVPMAEINLLRFIHMPNAPVIKNGRKFLIKTLPMIEFMANQADAKGGIR